jgi:hypothetical protein
MNIKHLHRSMALVAVASLGLAACGGGSKGGAAPPAAPPPAFNTDPSGTVSGSGTKGIIQNGVVEMSQFDASGELVLIGTGTTDVEGNYSVAYENYTGGPVQVCIKAATSGTPTTVVCDATDGEGCGVSPTDDRGAGKGDADESGFYELGETLPAPTGFELCTCLPGPPLAGVRAPITPFTQLVVARAAQRAADTALSESLAVALDRAASEINQLLGGLDVLRQEPINLADPAAVAAASPNQLVYAALSAATLANQVRSGPDAQPISLTAVISTLVAQAGSGAIQVSDLRKLVADAQAQLLGAGVASDNSGVLAELELQADDAQAACGEGVTDCSFDPAPAENAGSNGIARAKNLVANVRNTINGLNELEQPADAFGTQLEMAAAIIDPDDVQNADGSVTPVLGPVDFLFEGLAEVLGAAAFCVEDNTTVSGDDENTSAATCGPGYEVKGTYPADRTDEINGYLTTFGNFPATITVNSGQVTVAIKGMEADNVDADLTASFPNQAETTTTATLNASFTGTVFTTAAGPGLRLDIPSPDAGTTGATATLTKTGSVALSDGNDTTDDAKRISSASFNLPNITLAQTNAPPEQEGGAVSFTGELGGTIVRCTKASCVAREEAEPTLEEPDNGDATFFPSAVNLKGTFSNALNSTDLAVVVTVANAANFDPEFDNGSGDSLTTDNFPQASATVTFNAVLGTGDTQQAVRVLLTGTLNGVFVQPETEGDGTFSDPNVTATLTLLRRTPSDADLVQVFRVQGNTFDDGADTGGFVTVTDSANAQMQLNFPGTASDDGTQGEVRVDGAQVGVIRELSTGLVVVRYDDGTFETLF